MSIEKSIRSKLLLQSSVTAIVGSGTSARIRPYKLWQKDDITESPAVVIRVNREEDQNDMEYEGGLIIADVSVVAIAMELEDTRDLAKRIKTNNTNPGTGLAHGEWNTLAVPLNVQSCCCLYTEYDFIFFGDDSDEGYYVADTHYTIIYDETI